MDFRLKVVVATEFHLVAMDIFSIILKTQVIMVKNPIGVYQTAREEITGMAWMEKSFNNNFDLLKAALEKQFEKYFIRQLPDKRFVVSDGLTMKVVSLGSSVVMDYRSKTDWDDGDQYCPSDYDSFDEMFADMLAETQRVEDDQSPCKDGQNDSIRYSSAADTSPCVAGCDTCRSVQF